MKKLSSKKFISLGLISVATASMLYAETPETPPSPTDTDNTTLTDGYPDSNTSETINQFVSCENGSYFNPMTDGCTTIKPLSLAELQTGVWLDIVVDKSGELPVPTSDISGCTTITGMNSSDLNITTMFKNEDNATEIESTQWAYYDETTGRLEMSFPMDNYDDTSGSEGTTASTDMETL